MLLSPGSLAFEGCSTAPKITYGSFPQCIFLLMQPEQIHVTVSGNNAHLPKNTRNLLAQSAMFLEPPVNHHRSSHVLPNGSSVIQQVVSWGEVLVGH